jgi:hypothetical protein
MEKATIAGWNTVQQAHRKINLLLAKRGRAPIRIDTVRRYCHRGQLLAVRFAGALAISDDEVARFAAQHRGPGRPKETLE